MTQFHIRAAGREFTWGGDYSQDAMNRFLASPTGAEIRPTRVGENVYVDVIECDHYTTQTYVLSVQRKTTD